MTFPVIDIFAGPGGLSEGFSSFKNDKCSNIFNNILSVEHEEFAHKTLLLRHVFRQFPVDEVPKDYYRYISGKITRDEFQKLHKEKFDKASHAAIKLSLEKASRKLLSNMVTSRLGEAKRWALVGGPPCQAYSLVGRSRRKNDPDFDDDKRNFLYREYLNFISRHHPPVFVMENVVGLLSAQVKNLSVLEKILKDLQAPRAIIKGYGNGLKYKLYSLTEKGEVTSEHSSAIFTVKAEKYGIPQARHRIFILGIRADIKVSPDCLVPSKAPSVADVIGSLPAIRSRLSREADSDESWRAAIGRFDLHSLERQLTDSCHCDAITARIKTIISTLHTRPMSFSSVKYKDKKRSVFSPIVQSLMDPHLSSVSGHETRSHMASDLHRYLFASTYAEVVGKSPRLRDFPRFLLPNHKNVEAGLAGRVFADRFKV